MGTYTYSITAPDLPEYSAEFVVTSGSELSAGDVFVFTTEEIASHAGLTGFTVNVLNEESALYKEEFRWSTDGGSTWSGWADLSDSNSTQSVNYEPLDSVILSYRLTVLPGQPDMRVYGLLVTGTRTVEEASGPVVLAPGDTTIFRPTDVYKIFQLTGVEVTQTGADDTNPLTLHYRYSYTSGKTWSEWELMTNENLASSKITPLRHVVFEVSASNDGVSDISIDDIELTGRFQNVTRAYNTSARIGIRAACTSEGGNDGTNSCSACGGSGGAYNPCPSCGEVATFNPYAIGNMGNFYEYLNSSVASMWGHEVDYFKVNPDENGIDEIMHEYQLYDGHIQPKKLKVMVPQNQFPDNQIKFNEFNLDLFETFEVQITKADFRAAFGIEYRPNRKDVLFFCSQNRIYEVEHVMHDRGAFSTSTYYRVVMKKFSKDASVKWTDADAASAIEALTADGTLEDLFSKRVNEQTVDTTKPEQTKDQVQSYRVRKYIGKNVKVVQADMLNSSVLVSTGRYTMPQYLSQATIDGSKIGYGELDNSLAEGESRAVSLWTSFGTVNQNHNYVMFDNFNANSSLGYKLSWTGNVITFNVNGTEYEQAFTPEDDTWYCVYAGINGKTQELEIAVYSRYSEDNPETLTTADLLTIVKKVWTGVVVSYQKTGDAFVYGPDASSSPKAKKAYSYLTNIRLYSSCIENKFRNRTLNSLIVKEEQNLVFRDNAESELDLPKYGII